MLGSDLIKVIVDKDLVDKEILVIGNYTSLDNIEDESSSILSVQLVEDLGAGILVVEGEIEK